MQISLSYFKNDETYCHCTNISKNFNKYMNLTLKTEKQEIDHLNHSNAL